VCCQAACIAWTKNRCCWWTAVDRKISCVPHGSVAPHFRCGGIFNIDFIHFYPSICLYVCERIDCQSTIPSFTKFCTWLGNVVGSMAVVRQTSSNFRGVQITILAVFRLFNMLHWIDPSCFTFDFHLSLIVAALLLCSQLWTLLRIILPSCLLSFSLRKFRLLFASFSTHHLTIQCNTPDSPFDFKTFSFCFIENFLN